MTTADIVTSLSVAISALSFVYGVYSWRREFVGKRRIELAENLLSLFYEVYDAIREIRNPLGSVEEGTTRKRSDRENEKQSKILDRAFVAIERYQKRERLFAELRSMRYRVMATFGAEYGEPFNEINRVLSTIFSSANLLGNYYWKKADNFHGSDEKFEKFQEQLHKHESNIWFIADGNDEIDRQIQMAIGKVELLVKKTVKR
jgi:hypothetical protein